LLTLSLVVGNGRGLLVLAAIQLIQAARKLASRLNTLLPREPLDLMLCKRQWLQAVAEAKALFNQLPLEEVGCLYLDANKQAVISGPSSTHFSQLRRRHGSVRGLARHFGKLGLTGWLACPRRFAPLLIY
jgi:hypothetical protein